MSTSDRPSGLTALAVINFVTGTFQFFSAVAFLLRRFVFSQRFEGRELGEDEHHAEGLQALLDVPVVESLVYSSLYLAAALLLIVTGVGYLKRKKFFGRHLTTVYVICDLGALALMFAWLPESYIRELGIAVLRMAFYPLFIGAVIHTVFRRDLMR